MNREIKFNFWQKSTQTMLKWDDYIEYGIFEMFKSDDLIPLQYTGLKDKNGKEVHVGDLLRQTAKDSWDKTNYTCFEVFFHGGDSHLNYDIGYSMCRTHHHGSVCGGAILPFKPKTVAKMEVIGNIYENPELLK